jgi:hypothetical protein
MCFPSGLHHRRLCKILRPVTPGATGDDVQRVQSLKLNGACRAKHFRNHCQVKGTTRTVEERVALAACQEVPPRRWRSTHASASQCGGLTNVAAATRCDWSRIRG